jgi:predicted nucleotidyltransferase
MSEATEHLRALARRLVAAALERVPVRGALLVGSAARGDADFYSDLDLILYVDEVPSEETFADIRTAVDGTEPTRRNPNEDVSSEEFDLQGVRTEVSFIALAWIEARLDELLDNIEDFDSSLQKVLSGLDEGLPLHGEALIGELRGRVGSYPEPLRRAMVERRWKFFPLWYYGEAMAARDAELWRLDMLLDAAFNLLAVLAALNRLYFTRFELKRMRALIGRMERVPSRLADRLESLFRLAPESAAAELGRLVEETKALIADELPDVELAVRFSPGTRQQPWSV